MHGMMDEEDDDEEVGGLDLILGPLDEAEDGEDPFTPTATSAEERKKMALDAAYDALEAKDREGFALALEDAIEACLAYKDSEPEAEEAIELE